MSLHPLHIARKVPQFSLILFYVLTLLFFSPSTSLYLATKPGNRIERLIKRSYSCIGIPLYYKKCSRFFIRCKDPAGEIPLDRISASRPEKYARQQVRTDEEVGKRNGQGVEPVLFFLYVEMHRLSIKTIAWPAPQSAAELARREISTCRLTSFFLALLKARNAGSWELG